MAIKSAQWDIVISDNGEGQDPRYVVRCAKKGEAVVVYGTGETELQALYDAQDKMKEHVQKP